MQNALAVYTSKPSLNGRKLADLAQEWGIQIRFMALGGYIPGDPTAIERKALAAVNGGALLLVGAFEADAATLAEFDQLVALGDRVPIATILNGGRLPWCELYTKRFSYEQMVAQTPKDKAKIDGSVPKGQLPALKASKTRYILYNQSRRKNGGQLITRLAELLAKGTDGVVADYERPSR